MGSLGLYGVGLIAPLTPSEGMPSILAIILFVGGPLAGVGFAVVLLRSWLARLPLIVVGCVIIGFSVWLLAQQAGLLSHPR